MDAGAHPGGVAVELVSDYRDMPRYREAFFRLAERTFAIDFGAWYRAGFWDSHYVCYSLWDGAAIVSNVSVYSLDVVANGVRRTGLQLGAVMTAPEHRNRGYAARLLDAVFEEFRDDEAFFYLFANKTVLDFYPRFGFAAQAEQRYSREMRVVPVLPRGLRKLDRNRAEDVALVERKARLRGPLSEVFWVDNADKVLLFHFLNGYRDCFYYLEEEEAIVVAEQEGETLNIYDVVGEGFCRFDKVAARLARQEAARVVFHFVPDRLGVDYAAAADAEAALFTKPAGAFGGAGGFRYPALAQT